MTLRKLLFWPHLIAGTIAGAVILMMSVTGVLLMYEKQMISWADEREYRFAPQAARLAVEDLIRAVKASKGVMPSAVTLRSDPAAPAIFVMGRDGNLYVNPYTAEVLGSGSPAVRRFFRSVTEWHRWFGAEGDRRPAARAITGACNLAFLFLVCSGLYLWWPKRWTRQHLKPITLFRGGLSGKARDFNWHNVIGIWCAVPLFCVGLGATVISYPWASNMVYRLAGSAPPKAQGSPRGGAEGDQSASIEGIDKAWVVAGRQVSNWRTMTLRIPASEKAPLTFTIDQGYAGQPQKRTILTLNGETNEIVKAEPFSSYDAGRRARMWLRFVHTGEYYGLPGQTIAGIASGGAAVLVWTGIALSLRRFRVWRSRKQVKEEVLSAR
jgi:uncharacterized iron-regulated membrane protein